MNPDQTQPASAQEQAKPTCRPNCGHTREEHEAFDDGLACGQQYDEDECSNPYSDHALNLAWASGYSVGQINRRTPAHASGTEGKTPECDAVGSNGGYYRSKEHGWYLPISFARQLEAQRDAARADLLEWQTNGSDVKTQKEIVTLRDANAQLEAQLAAKDAFITWIVSLIYSYETVPEMLTTEAGQAIPTKAILHQRSPETLRVEDMPGLQDNAGSGAEAQQSGSGIEASDCVSENLGAKLGNTISSKATASAEVRIPEAGVQREDSGQPEGSLRSGAWEDQEAGRLLCLFENWSGNSRPSRGLLEAVRRGLALPKMPHDSAQEALIVLRTSGQALLDRLAEAEKDSKIVEWFDSFAQKRGGFTRLYISNSQDMGYKKNYVSFGVDHEQRGIGNSFRDAALSAMRKDGHE